MIHNLKKLIDLIWTIWCLISGSILILLNLPILLTFVVIFRNKKNNALDYYIRFTSACILFLWGIKMNFIQGLEIDNTKSGINGPETNKNGNIKTKNLIIRSIFEF